MFNVWCGLMNMLLCRYTIYAYIFMYLLIITRQCFLSLTKYVLLQHNLKKLPGCKTNAFHCLYIFTVPVYHTSSVANQVQVNDMYCSCVAHVHWWVGGCMSWLRAMVCVDAKFLSFTCGKHASMCMCACTYVKLKLSCTVYCAWLTLFNILQVVIIALSFWFAEIIHYCIMLHCYLLF